MKQLNLHKSEKLRESEIFHLTLHNYGAKPKPTPILPNKEPDVRKHPTRAGCYENSESNVRQRVPSPTAGAISQFNQKRTLIIESFNHYTF